MGASTVAGATLTLPIAKLAGKFLISLYASYFSGYIPRNGTAAALV